MRLLSLIFIVFLYSACNSGSTAKVETNNNTATSIQTTNLGPVKTIVSADPIGSADIEVEVLGIPDGPVSLIGHLEDRQFRVDSSYLQNGKTRFVKKEGYQQGFYFIYLPNRMGIQVLLGEDQKFSISTDADDFMMATEVKGSEDNIIFYQNLKFQEEQIPLFQTIAQNKQGKDPVSLEFQKLDDQQNALLEERKKHLNEIFTKYPNSLFTVFKKAGQNPDLQDIRNPDGTVDQATQIKLYLKDFWKDVDFSDERLLRTPVISNKLKRYFKELTPQHQDSIIKSADALVQQVEGRYPAYFKFFVNWVPLQYQPTQVPLMDAEAVMVHMVQNYFTTEKATWTSAAEIQGLQQRAMEMEASLVGRKGPDVISTDPSGKQRSIYDMKQDYITVLLFNPECEHCIEETPQLLALHRRLKKDMGIYAIAIDTDDTKWRNFIQQFGTQEWTNVYDPTNRSIYAKYFVDKTPEIYVLDPDRTIIAKNIKVFQLEEVIRRDKEKRGRK